MRKKIQLIPSGISFVDETWGGFYNCGTYLLVGPHKSGKTLLGLQFIKEAINQKAVCVYFSNMRPKDLMINAASINFDLQYFMDQNQVILIRINLPKEKDAVKDNDKYLSGYFQDIVSVIEQYQPSKVVFDELTPFVNFNDPEKLEEVFIQTTEAIDNLGVTPLFILSQPASQQSRIIVEHLSKNSTGVIKLEKASEESFGGSITVTPNVGHIEGEFKTLYKIEPGKGVTTSFSKTNNSDVPAPHKTEKKSFYKSLSEFENSKEYYPVINFYNEKEFRLLLNNQIALFKSTSKQFTLCSIVLDKEAEEKSLITINQLKNAVRLSVSRKDKITVIDERIIVLVIDEDQKIMNRLFSNIKSNLPAENNEQLTKIVNHISVFTIQVDSSINNADDMLNRIFSDKVRNENFN